MDKQLRTRLWGAIAGAFAAVTLSSSVMALEDVLETPSMETSKATQSLLLDVAVAGGSYVAAGERGHIIFSRDQGKNWEQAQVPVSTTLTGIFFVDESNGWAVGHGGVVLVTTDGGKSWAKQMDGYLANQMVIKAAQEKIKRLETKLASASGDAASDLEMELETATYALDDAKIDAEVGASKPLLDVWFKDKNTGFVVGAYGYIFRTDDGGNTWKDWSANIQNVDRFHYNAITQITGGALFIVGEAGIVFRSTNNGDTWDTIESPYDGSFFGVTGTGNVNEVLAFGLRGNLFRSTNLGDTWDSVQSGVDVSLTSGWSSKGGVVTIVGVSGVVVVSNDAGETFQATERQDRLSLSNVIRLPDDHLLLFGEGGVVIADSRGRDL